MNRRLASINLCLALIAVLVGFPGFWGVKVPGGVMPPLLDDPSTDAQPARVRSALNWTD